MCPKELRNMRVVVTVTLLVYCTLLGWSENASGRPFTVQDLIEISYFIDGTEETNIVGRGTYPPGGAIIAPDQKHFLLITQRGVLATNKLEATLWVVDREAITAFVSKRDIAKPALRQVARLSARSSTPVISSVRWLEDSNRIAFLGKSDSSCQQLFIANLYTGSVSVITDQSAYVTAYDIRDETVVYTTLDPRTTSPAEQVVDVTGRNLYSLLFRKGPEQPEELDEGVLRTIPSVLHVQRNGRELPTHFLFNGKPLRLFMPTLALSPNGRLLVTVAPPSDVPLGWKSFQPAVKTSFLYLNPENKNSLSDENPFKASQYVVVNLQDGSASAIIDAPAGRGLGYYRAPTKGVWFSDSRRVILSNTFLPLNTARGEEDKVQRADAPSIAVFDFATHTVQSIAYLSQPPSRPDSIDVIREVSLAKLEHSVSFGYAKLSGDQAGIRLRETYDLETGVWRKVSQRNMSTLGESTPDVELSVTQDLDQPPVLSGCLRGSTNSSTVWDPNPQLRKISIGKTFIYHWKDKYGHKWSGILALPPNYDPKVRYPMVIQTYGYERNKFFADGAYTTGYGGRALAAKGIIVLQSDEAMAHMGTPQEGPDQIAIFESAINQLSTDGLVDPRRVGIIGFSRTCFHVLYSMTHRPELFAAASITDGLNFGYLQYVLFTDYFNYQELFEGVNGGVPFGQGLKTWGSSAPEFNLDKIKTPLMISALEKGELIWEWETYSGLRKLNKPVDMWWLRMENATHILTQPDQRYTFQQLAVDWFSFWLKGEEDTDSTKAAEYARWRELRQLSKGRQRAEGHTSH
jgi:hypothetical protein